MPIQVRNINIQCSLILTQKKKKLVNKSSVKSINLLISNIERAEMDDCFRLDRAVHDKLTSLKIETEVFKTFARMIKT